MTKAKSEELVDADLDAVNGGLKMTTNDIIFTSLSPSSSTIQEHEPREHVQFCYQSITSEK